MQLNVSINFNSLVGLFRGSWNYKQVLANILLVFWLSQPLMFFAFGIYLLLHQVYYCNKYYFNPDLIFAKSHFASSVRRHETRGLCFVTLYLLNSRVEFQNGFEATSPMLPRSSYCWTYFYITEVFASFTKYAADRHFCLACEN